MDRLTVRNIAEVLKLKYRNKFSNIIFDPIEPTADEINLAFNIDKVQDFENSWYLCDDNGSEINLNGISNYNFKSIADSVKNLQKDYVMLKHNEDAIAEHIRLDNLKDPKSIDNRIEYLRKEIVDLQMSGISKIALGFISVSSLIISIIALCIK